MGHSRGVLLVGPPGTGKTLLARAIAKPAVPFFSISGSDFVEMFVGVGASRVRDMFEQGKKNSPVLFLSMKLMLWDGTVVLDTAGAMMSGSKPKPAFGEMDGFDENQGIIIIAATNRPDVLDPACCVRTV